MPHSDPLMLALWCLGAFLAGSIPFGLILVKVAGKGDVREHGSGNIGATNVSRVGGKGLGILVLLLDMGKGYLPVFWAQHQGLELDAQVAVALCAVLGHAFTPWLSFQGGKGVATALGTALAYRASAVVPPFIVFVLLVLIFRYVSLGSIVSAALLPVCMGWPREVSGFQFLAWRVGLREQDPWQATFLWALIAILVIAKHHENLRRLVKGTESKLWGA